MKVAPEGSPEDGVCPDILFLRVDEPKTAKVRIHLDLQPDDQEAERILAEANRIFADDRLDVPEVT